MMLLNKLKKTLCFSICAIAACAHAHSATLSAPEQTRGIGLRTVVLDPGHGGKDTGAPGQTSSTSEKHVVLKVAKLLGEKIKAEYPDVKVVYTRSKDVFVELNERARIAKVNNADLFISIHCNSNTSKSPYGASVHILGPKSSNKKNNGDYFQKSMSVAQRENSVMLLEDDYKTKYEGFDPDSPESVISHSLMWNANYENSLILAAEMDKQFHKSPFRVGNYTGIHQDVFYLLWATNMPAVLLELGFISNPSDYKYMSTEWGQKQMAQRLFEAFSKYKAYYEGSLDSESMPGTSSGQSSSGNASKAVSSGTSSDQSFSGKASKAVSSGTSSNAPSKVSSADSSSADRKLGQTYYGVQIMGLGRLIKSGDPAFKGLKVVAVKSSGSGIYKYVTACSSTRGEAASQLAAVRKKFPEAFVVKVSGNEVTRN